MRSNRSIPSLNQKIRNTKFEIRKTNGKEKRKGARTWRKASVGRGRERTFLDRMERPSDQAGFCRRRERWLSMPCNAAVPPRVAYSGASFSTPPFLTSSTTSLQQLTRVTIIVYTEHGEPSERDSNFRRFEFMEDPPIHLFSQLLNICHVLTPSITIPINMGFFLKILALGPFTKTGEGANFALLCKAVFFRNVPANAQG